SDHRNSILDVPVGILFEDTDLQPPFSPQLLAFEFLDCEPHGESAETAVSLFSQRCGSTTEFQMPPFSYPGSPSFVPTEMQLCAVRLMVVAYVFTSTRNGGSIELYGAISELQNAHPNGLFIIAGDFNHVNLKTVLPKFHHYVDSATRGANTLGLVYTNIPGGYRAEPHPHLGYSDHISLMQISAYRPLVRRSKRVLKQVKTWPAGAISALQDCFECTDWNMLREAATNNDSINLEEYKTSVTSYIGKCIDDMTVSKTITTRTNQKPWMTAKVRTLLKSSDFTFRAGDKTALKTARAKLSRAIKEAKCAHAQRIHSHFQDNRDSRPMWQSIQMITNYKTTSPACDNDSSLPDMLNDFYARFEAQNNVTARKTIPALNYQVLCLSMADVKRTLYRVNPRKAGGPDNITARVLRECASSLSIAVVTTCLKTMTSSSSPMTQP
ncbi:hypothetical protein QTP70_028376, partial [Hemibagrus guttatus]